MRTKEQIQKKIQKLEKDYSPDGKSIRLNGKPQIENRVMIKILKWILK